MTLAILFLIFISVFLSVAAQILLKHGMSSPSVAESLGNGTAMESIWAIATNLSVFSGLTAYVASAGVWLLVLSKLDVSKAYPFVGLGFVLTMLFAYFFLNEPITTMKLAGTLLVFAGVVMISVS